MNELLRESTYFGLTISLVAYGVGVALKKRVPHPLVSPLVISSLLVIGFLLLFRVDYETYRQGSQYISVFLTPATVCLAVPLYKQIHILKKHLGAVVISILSGCLAHLCSVIVLAQLFKLEESILLSVLSKSVTTPIAIGIAGEMGGIPSITIVGVTVAGMLGAVLGPSILKVFHIQEPIAQGLAIGTSSHALGTSRMVEEGEMQGAMSSLAIVIAGILTVIIVPIIVPYL